MGKTSKHRQCPALSREISAAECGENRLSRYACPPDCPHNPFVPANYPALLTLEDALDAKTLDWMFREARDRAGLERAFRQAVAAKSGHALHAFTVWHLFLHRDEAGLTCAQRWERAGFPGLKNDERVFLRAKMQTRVLLLETHCVRDDQSLEAADLLAPAGPAPLLILDRSLAARTPRFATYLTWGYPLPHFWRMFGTAIVISDIGDLGAADIVTETARHLGAPAGDTDALRRWLAEHFVRVDESLTATAGERHRLMLAGIDAQFGTAVYDLCAPFAEGRAALDGDPAVDPNELSDKERDEGFTLARDWFDDSKSSGAVTPDGGRLVLGRVLLGPKNWRLVATGAARLARLRARFEARLGRRVRFTHQRLDDLGTRLALQRPPADPALVPPRLLENPPQVALSTSRIPAPPPGATPEELKAAYLAGHLRTFADHPVPALDGRTPRAAAADPALRPKLLHLMKSHVRALDESNLCTGRTDDINWLLRELGLAEIDFPPPPRRGPPPDLDESDDLDESLEEDDAMPRPLAGPLPAEPLTLEQAETRLEAAMAQFEMAADALDELAVSGSTLIDDVDELTSDLLSEEEFNVLIPFLLSVWFALVPRGVAAPPLNLPRMTEALRQETERLPAMLGTGPEGAMNSLLAGCPQPMLLQLVMAGLFEASTKVPKKLRPKPEAQAVMVLILKIVITELDRALRRG